MRNALFTVLAGMWLASALCAQWSTPVPLFTGSTDQTEVFFANKTENGVMGSTEWMTFVRSTIGSSAVAVARTQGSGSYWSDSLDFVTPDTVWADQPTLALFSQWNGDTLMVVYRQLSGIPGLYYSMGVSGTWSSPLPVISGTMNMDHPFLIPIETGFGLVWEREGGIYFSTYRNGSWSLPALLSTPGDTTNHHPSLRGESWNSKYVTVWEKTRAADTMRSVVYAVGSDTGWGAPDTLLFSGDLRRPRFVREGFAGFVDVMYESNIYGPWKICGASGYVNGSTIFWFSKRDTMELYNEPMPPGDQHESSFMIVPIITEAGREAGSLSYVAGVWKQTIDGIDSVVIKDMYTSLTRFRTSSVGVRRPDISGGSLLPNGYVRVWTVWESFNDEHWRLYGSYNDLPILDVHDNASVVPRGIELFSNYPNPFNPSTTLSYRLTEAARVTLAIYNMNGQEVRRLTQDVFQTPGVYRITWDGHDAGGRRVGSGVYIGRLSSSSGFSISRKMVLVK